MTFIPSLSILPEAPVTKSVPSWDPPQGSILPNLRTKVLHDGVLRPMYVNTTTPVSFNTDLFEGKVLLAVNSAAETREPFVGMFQANKQVKFELQVQGKFKRVPDGPIFFGGEITKKMELGMITRGICGGLLQMGRAVNAYMHHSFGDTKNVELPHITGPFWSSVDRLNITPVGQTPPPFLESFPEDAKARAARKANPEYTVNVDLGATYSFSLKTSKMDLEEWAIATSSYTKSMNLSMFWADADLRFVCYCVPANAPGIEYNSHGLPKLHPQDKISHFFSLEVQHISNHTDWAEETIESDGLGRPISVENMQLLQATLPVYQEKHERYQGYESVRLYTTQLAGIFEQDLDDTSPRMSLASVGSVLSNDDTEETTEFHDAVLGPEELFELEAEPVTAREFAFDADSDRNTKIPFPPMDTDTSLQESTEEVSALLREKLSLLQDRIMTHSAKHLQEHKSEPFPKKKANLLGEPMIISTKVKRSLVAAVLEVDDDRSHKKGKRHWNLGDKMILNGRNFTCSGVYHQLSLRTLELGKLVNDPCKLVAKLLEMAFKLSSEEPGAAEVSVWVTEYAADRPPDLSEPTDFQSLWVDFMDGVSLLQCIDLSEMDKTSPEATCLFLNLYHCLLIHAYLVVGLPNSLFKWSNFFRFCSYEAFGDIFSLAELEHCILRGAMSRPSINFLAQHFLIPNVEYSFALQIRDYRLLWGIFCGATSNMSEIPIYTPEDLDKQLDAIIRLSLAAEVKFKDDHSVVLPVPCQLFSKEFDPSYQVAATPKQVLSVLVQHLSGEQRAAARALIARKGPLSVKYTPFNFQCKYPTRLSETTLRAAMESCDSFDAATSLGLGQIHV
eukprot:gene10838-12651_t